MPSIIIPTERPWTRLYFDSNWAEFHEQSEGSPTEGMVPLFAGHSGFDGEVREYEATVEGFAPDEATARLYGAAYDLAEVVIRWEQMWSRFTLSRHGVWPMAAEEHEDIMRCARAALAKALGTEEAPDA